VDLLLVEDNFEIVTLWLPHLTRAAFHVDVVITVAAAIAAVLQRPYDVVVLDLKLPDGDGLDVLQMMRRRGIETPVVIQSGHGTYEAALNAGGLGAVAFLEKPVGLTTLIARVTAAAASVKTTSDPLARAEGELSEVHDEGQDAAVLCAGVLLRAMADRALTLRQFERLRQELILLTATNHKPDLARLVDAIGDASTLQLSEDRQVDRILAVLAYAEVSGATALAEACGMSARAVRDQLTEVTGCGISAWRRLSRVRRVVIAVAGTQEPVSQCAYNAGYAHNQASARDCGLLLGLTPTRIRIWSRCVNRVHRV